MNPDKINIERGWKEILTPFFISDDFDCIYSVLRTEHATGKSIFPASASFWKPFNHCPYENLKVVLIADGPYNEKMEVKNGSFVMADGIALSCSSCVDLPRSLDNWYKGMEQDLFEGLNLLMYLNTDLSYLADQGVLMLNSSFTTVEKADNHFDLWKPFYLFLLEQLNKYPTNLIFILIGEQSKTFLPYINSPFILECEHPDIPLTEYRTWRHNNIFSNTNKILKKERNHEIIWVEEVPFAVK